MILRRWFLVLLMLAALPLAAAAERGFELLSHREYQDELAARAQPGAKFVAKAADFNAPTITVSKPDTQGPISPPVDIDIQFTPAAGAAVNVGSLKILYGFLKLDITQRILGAPGVQVSAAGLKAAGAKLPSGSHKLLIEIADNLGRVGRRSVEFVVQ